MKGNKFFLESLEDGHFKEVPVGSSFIEIKISPTTTLSIRCEGSDIILHAGGLGRKTLTITPIESESIRITVNEEKPINPINPIEDVILPTP